MYVRLTPPFQPFIPRCGVASHISHTLLLPSVIPSSCLLLPPPFMSRLQAALVAVLLVCGVACVAADTPTHSEWDRFNLNVTIGLTAPYSFVLGQWTGETVIVAPLYNYLVQWQWHNSAFMGEYNYEQAAFTSYAGRIWVANQYSSYQYAFNVLDDKLKLVNSVLVNTTEPWATARYWQVAVDEAASLLYSAAMIDHSMRLHCWTFGTDNNSSSLLFSRTLPLPYLPATLYQGAKHTLLLTFEGSTLIHRLDGRTGEVVSTFDAPEGAPTALVESADGSVLYVSAEWPNVAAYDIATGAVLAYYQYSGVWDPILPADQFVSLTLTGDGEWLFGAASVKNTPIMRWRVGHSHHVYAPHLPHSAALGLNYTEQSVGILAQYSGDTIVAQLPNELVRWQLNNSIFLSSTTPENFLATTYRGRIWLGWLGWQVSGLQFAVMDDQLEFINMWNVSCTAFDEAAHWQVAVDEDTGLLYSAGMIDSAMQLYAWQIGPTGNTTSFVFSTKLPTPYLPATLYQGAKYTLLVTYQDDTHIYRLCGYTGALLSVFNASATVPTAVAESYDGRVLYVSADWPSIAAYDSATGELLTYYDYADGGRGKGPRDTFVSASISGDGQWLFGYAETQSLVVQWRINNSNSGSVERFSVQLTERPRRMAAPMQMATE